MLAVALVLSLPASAKRAAVPVAPVRLPATVDWQAEYQGQVLCSDWSKPGAVRLKRLLRRTYGSYLTYIPRSCDTPGISEHEEGRALDWMVDSEDPVARRKARAFLRWLVAPGRNGEPGANARRLGVMYLIYEDKMWRVYRPEDGWQEYSGCSATQGEEYDTSCHRDHIHVSLTWDGAYAQTSFWTGRAETRPPCDSAFATRPNGSRTAPRTLINTDSGVGVPGKRCRLSAGTSYSSRSYAVQVPVPQLPDGARPVQHVVLERFSLGAPVGLTIRSATTQVIPQGTDPGTPIAIPLARTGVIRLSLDAGYAQVWLRGLGVNSSTEPIDPPGKSRVTLPSFRAKTRVNTPVTVSGALKRVTSGARLTIRRRLGSGPFTAVARVAAPAARYRLVTPGVTQAGRYRYQALLTVRGKVVDRSAARGIVVDPATVTLTAPRPRVQVGRKVRLAGTLAGAPTGASLLVMARARGGDWRVVQTRRIGNGGYKTRKRVRAPGKFVFKTVLVSPGRLWAASPVHRVRATR